MKLLLTILLIIGTYFSGTIIEKRHFKKIQQREIALIRRPVIAHGKRWRTKKNIKKIELVTGEVVIAGDYFKTFVADLKNFFGGRLTSFESVLDRARREAVLRMREKAKNAHIIVNVKLETAMLNNDQMKASPPQCAVIAYGTAITYEKWLFRKTIIYNWR